MVGVRQIRLIAADPGIDHPLLQQLQRLILARKIKVALDPARWQTVAEPRAGAIRRIQPQRRHSSQPCQLVHLPFRQQQAEISLQLQRPRTGPVQVELKGAQGLTQLTGNRALVNR